jgi:hypothetical protein
MSPDAGEYGTDPDNHRGQMHRYCGWGRGERDQVGFSVVRRVDRGGGLAGSHVGHGASLVRAVSTSGEPVWTYRDGIRT